MSNQDCAFIASQIPVLPGNTESQADSSVKVPTPHSSPVPIFPADVRELKPLPDTVTQRLPALRGDQYLLAGQDIVVVGKGPKIAS